MTAVSLDLALVAQICCEVSRPSDGQGVRYAVWAPPTLPPLR